VRAPDFWARPFGPAAAALTPLSLVYGLAAELRFAAARPRSAPLPVICVGNLVAGGQGKTPTALALGEILREAGRSPAFLTRGHGGRLSGPVLVDPERHEALDVGDEPLLLARFAPTIVSRRRLEGALLAASMGADVVVMDDGFQNPGLAKDLSLVVVDAGFGIGNGRIMPAGPLRAPLGRQLARAGGVVVVGQGAPAEPVLAEARRRGLPVLRARLEPGEAARGLRGERVLAYAGIGRPAKFFETLEALGAELSGTRSFPDHHRFTEEDAAALLGQAERLGARLVTTEKDWVRLRGGGARGDALRAASTPVPVTLQFEDGAALEHLLRPALRGISR